MVPVPDYHRPPSNMFSLLAKQAPGILRSAWKVSKKYKKEARA
jgi:hypothetical protein